MCVCVWCVCVCICVCLCGVSMQVHKFEASPSIGCHPPLPSTKTLSTPVPPLIADHILEKKVSLIIFRQILPKIFSVAHIFSNTIITNLKNLIGNKSLKGYLCYKIIICHIALDVELINFLFEEKIIIRSQDIEIFVFL